MTVRSCFGRLSALALSLPVLAAQSPTAIELPAGAVAPGSSLGRLALGDFDGDQRTDAVLLADDTPVVLWGVLSFVAATPLDSTGSLVAADLAVLPGSGASADEIVVTGPAGTGCWSFDTTLGVFVEEAVDSAAGTLVSVIRNREAPHDVATNDGTAAIAMHRRISGSFQPRAVLPTTLPPDEIVGVDWFGMSQRQVALRSGNLVEVREANTGIRVGSTYLGQQVRSIATIPSAGSERLAIVFELPLYGVDDWQWVSTFGFTAGLETWESLGDLGIYTTAVGAFGNDSLPDLVTFSTLLPELREYEGQGAQPVFVPGAVTLHALDPGTPVAQNAGSIALADLDNDQDADVLVPLQADQNLLFFAGSLEDAGALAPHPAEGAYPPCPVAEPDCLNAILSYSAGELIVWVPFEPQAGWTGSDSLEALAFLAVEGSSADPMGALFSHPVDPAASLLHFGVGPFQVDTKQATTLYMLFRLRLADGSVGPEAGFQLVFEPPKDPSAPGFGPKVQGINPTPRVPIGGSVPGQPQQP